MYILEKCFFYILICNLYVFCNKYLNLNAGLPLSAACQPNSRCTAKILIENTISLLPVLPLPSSIECWGNREKVLWNIFLPNLTGLNLNSSCSSLPAKQHVTEDKVAMSLGAMHISNQYHNHGLGSEVSPKPVLLL